MHIIFVPPPPPQMKIRNRPLMQFDSMDSILHTWTFSVSNSLYFFDTFKLIESAVLFFSWSPAFCIDVWLNQYAIWRFNWSHTATFPSAKLNDLGVVHTIWCYGDPAHQFFSQTQTRVECIDSHVSKGETVSANWIYMLAALFRFFAYFLTIQLYKHGMLSQDLKSETLQLFQIMSRKALYSRQEIWNFKHNYLEIHKCGFTDFVIVNLFCTYVTFLWPFGFSIFTSFGHMSSHFNVFP